MVENSNALHSMVSTSLGSAKVDMVVTKARRAKDQQRILHSMFVQFPEDQVTAILGPSGSGKTTLLDFLTGSISGGLTARGEVNFPNRSAYVPQGDRLHGFYTCYDYMLHYARLSGLNINDETKRTIDNLLESLGLSNQKNTIVGDIFLRGLSGGQQRRLSVALEALTSPSTLFLDEPTSGLDSQSALQLVKFLNRYVREAPGRRVILTIHQPSSFIWQEIDNVVLLSAGKLMYQGKRGLMEEFFEANNAPTPPNYNPADHYVTMVNADFTLHDNTDNISPDEWALAFTQWNAKEDENDDDRLSNSSNDRAENNATLSRGSNFNAVGELTRRYFKNLVRNPGILGTRLAMYTVLSLLIGALFWNLGALTTFTSVQSRIALLFYCVAFFIFMSVAVLPFTVIERHIVEKEIRNFYYHPIVYQIAQAIASVPGAALLALVTTTLILAMTGLREPYWFFLDMFLSLVCAEALAQLISHLVPHFIIGIGLLAGVYGLFMLLQGFMLVPSEFPGWLKWTHNIAFHTYAWRSFMFSEFHDQMYPDAEGQGLENGNTVLEIYEIDDVNRANDMGILVGYAVIIHLISFIVIQYKYISMKKANAQVENALYKDKSSV